MFFDVDDINALEVFDVCEGLVVTNVVTVEVT